MRLTNQILVLAMVLIFASGCAVWRETNHQTKSNLTESSISKLNGFYKLKSLNQELAYGKEVNGNLFYDFKLFRALDQ